jgi:hypothetical protein
MALLSIAGALSFEDGVNFKHEKSCFHQKGRRIVYTSVIGRTQTGQMTSLISVTSSLVLHLWMRRRIPAMTQINCVCDFGHRFSLSAGGLSP